LVIGQVDRTFFKQSGVKIKWESRKNPRNSNMSQPQPTTTPNLNEPKFGFNQYTERLNGRAAMIGFLITLAIEYFSGQGLLSWLGLS
jgi:hypothetical protein